jgi:hypothetical protein
MDSTDLKMYKSKSNGRMSDTEIVSDRVQNLMVHVTSSQRTAGFFDYYKAWWQIDDDDDGVGIDPETYWDFPTLSDDDYVMMFEMDDRDAVTDITGYATGNDTERKYGVAFLAEDITAGDQTFDVVVKNAAMASGNDAIFADGDTIKITSKATDIALTGVEETHTIDGTPVVASDGVTITLTIADSGGFDNSYVADGSVIRVRSIIEPTSDIETSATAMVVTSAGDGDYDDTTYPIVLDNMGTVDEDWTLYFTDATHFRLDGDSLGNAVDTGDTSSDFAPSNAGRDSKPYFTIDADGFSGTFAAGDTITFTTKPAAYPIGIKRVVPALSGSLANNKVGAVLVVEAAPGA